MTLPIDIFFINLFSLTLGLIPVILVSAIVAKLVESLINSRREKKHMKQEAPRPQKTIKLVTNEDECFNCGCNLYKNCSGYKPEDEKKEKK